MESAIYPAALLHLGAETWCAALPTCKLSVCGARCSITLTKMDEPEIPAVGLRFKVSKCFDPNGIFSSVYIHYELL